jgi:hypothetical protein
MIISKKKENAQYDILIDFHAQFDKLIFCNIYFTVFEIRLSD